MANITVRTSTTATDPSSTSAKGSALSHTELDSNFILLNNEKLENAGTNDYTGDLQIKGSGGSTRGSTRFFNNDDSKYIELKAPATITSTTSFTLPPGDGANGQALITNGSGALVFSTVGGGGSSTQSTADSNFQLASNSNLDVNGNKIISTSNGDIDIEPHGTGDVLLGNFKFDADQTVGSSQDNMVLTYDNSTGKISLETNAATAGISNVVEDTSPELGGDLDILARKITSSSANVVISADATDKEVHIKVDDAGGTSQTAAEFRDFAFTENATAGNSGTAATKYNTIADLHKGIRIGSTSNNFSSTGAAGNNNNSAYNTSGILIGNKGNTWPVVDIISNGQSEGENPLYNKTGSSGLLNFPNGQFNFKASNGTAASPSALGSGNRMGQINWYGHDGTGYGGSSDAAPSATITATANETFSGDTRGGKLVIDVLPSGQSGGTGTTSSDRIEAIDITGSEVTINSSNANLDFKVNGDTDSSIFKVDAGTQRTEIAGDGLKIADDTKIRIGNDDDTEIRFRNSRTEYEHITYGNISIRASDSGASSKGNVLIRADNKIELRAGTDKDSKGDLILTAFDDFQFRKTGFASTDTDLTPTTNGTTSVVLGRALTTGETNAFNDFSLFFFDGDPTNSTQLKDMDRYIEVDSDTAITGSGATTTITLTSAVSNLSNATHSAGKYLQFNVNSTAVVVDGTRGRLEDKQVVIQNRLGSEGPVGMSLKFEAVEFHDGAEFLGTGTGQSDEAIESPVTYELFTEANKNSLVLEHSTHTAGSETKKDIYEIRGRSSTASTVASKTAPDMMRFNVDIDAEKTIVLHNQSGDPSTVANASHIYAKDESSSSEVFVRDEAGTVTRLSSHNEDGEWEYYSYHKPTGKRIKINMEEMIRDIEKLTGKNYIRNV